MSIAIKDLLIRLKFLNFRRETTISNVSVKKDENKYLIPKITALF